MTDADKINAFDEIATEFYSKNFGKLAKSDFELIMFKHYIKSFPNSSDYKVGLQLGLTPSRVKNLRVKLHLADKTEYDWKNELTNILSDSKNLHLENHYVKINLKEQMLFYAIEDYINEHGGFVDYSLNSKLLVIHEKYLLLFMDLVMSDEEKAKMRKIIADQVQSTDISSKKDMFDIVQQITEIGLNISEIIENIAAGFSPASTVFMAIKGICKIFRKD